MSFVLEWLVSSWVPGYYSGVPSEAELPVSKGMWRWLWTAGYIQPMKMPKKLSTWSLEDAHGATDNLQGPSFRNVGSMQPTAAFILTMSSRVSFSSSNSYK